jgi:hypothetical protein
MRRLSIDAWWYGAALWLYPPAFRREFQDELSSDFEDGRSEALAAGTARARWRFRAQLLLDLSRSLPVEWIRSGLPLVALLAAVVPMSAVYLLALGVSRVRIVLGPRALADADVIGVVLLASVCVTLIAMTIVLTLWFARPPRWQPRRLSLGPPAILASRRRRE